MEGREKERPCERGTVFEIVYDCAVQRALPFSALSFLPAAHGRSDYTAYIALIRFLLVLSNLYLFFLVLGGASRGYQRWSDTRLLSSVRSIFFLHLLLLFSIYVLCLRRFIYLRYFLTVFRTS